MKPGSLFDRIFGFLGQLIALNLLWIVCSLPIITAGASTTALYYCTLKLHKDGDIRVFHDFFKSFKQNFKQSTLIWILMAAVGATLGVNRSFFQGFFLAPMVTKGALKGAVFAANIYEKLGFPVIPDSTEPRQDIIQAVSLGTPEGLIAFCKGIQAAAPVDSYVDPEPWDMPGYDSQVIMAAGAGVQGSSIELSADGPMKPPYAVYFQGGLTWEHAKLGVLMSLQKMVDKGLVTL